MLTTPLGKRALKNKEKDLFMIAAGTGIDILTEIANDGYMPSLTGNRWDGLRWYQQICAIGEISRHLIEESSSMAPSEWSDLTVSSIYDFIIFTNPREFESNIMEAAEESGIKIKGANSDQRLDRILRAMRDRIINKQTKKSKIEKFGQAYYGELFPAFSMTRFTKTYEFFEKNPRLAVFQLPRSIQNRISNGFENEQIDYKPWYPLYNKKEVIFCWK